MSHKVLIADDEPNIVISLEFMMKREGYQVSVARDGAEALAGSATGETRGSDHEFAAAFLSMASEAGGFVEILACPDTGGLFAQGWAMALAPGPQRLARLNGTLELCNANAAVFPRDDIPPPGTGFCLFSLGWRGAELELRISEPFRV